MATVKLTTQQFKDDVFDYTTEKEWKYKGEKPAIIDFYADWCGPLYTHDKTADDAGWCFTQAYVERGH